MIRQLRTQVVIAMAAVAIGLLGPVLLAKVRVRVEAEKTFDFKAPKTWAWNPAGPGDVKMARTPDDDPEAIRKRFEPLIVETVAAEMPKHGLQAATGQPDLMLTYYLLLSIAGSAQTMGQFLPSTTQWGLPPFPPATTALTVMNTGSLVMDLAAGGNVVWRGVAQTEIQLDATEEKRASLVREGVRELLKKYPPKK